MQKYDKTSPKSIEQFAKFLIWKTFWDFLSPEFKNKKDWNKWNLWQLLEKYYFWKDLDNKSEADFYEAWLELKATPIKRIKKWEIRSKERLVLNIINYIDIVKEDWDNSSFIKKNSLILLIFYLYEEEKLSIDYIIQIVELFSFKDNSEDYNIIKNDWLKIQNKIKEWLAHELSEWDTIYLWACTKWSTAEDSLRLQPFSELKAKQRAFSFKQWYINYILKRFEWKNPRYEQLFKNKKDEWFNFEKELNLIFKKYIWMTANQIWNEFDYKYTGQKNYYAWLSSRIMWVQDINKIEEFEKANISLKTIRLTPTWTLKEDISFPSFKFNDIITQEWEESDLFNTLESQKFFFVIFKITTKTTTEFEKLSDIEKNNHLVLDKVVLWNTPFKDIEEKAKNTWEQTIKIIKDWVIITPLQKWAKTIFTNNLPSGSQTNMIHVRPHWINRDDTDILPDWRKLTKQCFWFNKEYIKKELGI